MWPHVWDVQRTGGAVPCCGTPARASWGCTDPRPSQHPASPPQWAAHTAQPGPGLGFLALAQARPRLSIQGTRRVGAGASGSLKGCPTARLTWVPARAGVQRGVLPGSQGPPLRAPQVFAPAPRPAGASARAGAGGGVGLVHPSPRNFCIVLPSSLAPWPSKAKGRRTLIPSRGTHPAGQGGKQRAAGGGRWSAGQWAAGSRCWARAPGVLDTGWESSLGLA